MKHSIINIALLFFLINNNASADSTFTRFKTPLEVRRELRSQTEKGKTITLTITVTNFTKSSIHPINKTATNDHCNASYRNNISPYQAASSNGLAVMAQILAESQARQKAAREAEALRVIKAGSSQSQTLPEEPVVEEYSIKITGSTIFKYRVNQALRLLKEYDKENFLIVLKNLNEIRENNESTMSFVNVGTRVTFFRLADTELLYWCASGLVHEASHIVYYKTFPMLQYWGTAAELFCIGKQRENLIRMRAPDYLIQYVAAQDGTHWMRK